MKKFNLKLLIGVFAVMLIPVIGINIYQNYELKQLMSEPIDSIQCSYDGEIRPTDPVSRSRLNVTAITTSGTAYRASDFTIDLEEAPAHGGEFSLTVSYMGKDQQVKIPIERNKVVEYSIGYPQQDDVIATVYSNGDLEFTGKGNTLTFRKGDLPWEADEYSYVNFASSEITPSNIDYWFMDNEELEECRNIPNSIVSAKETFAGCEKLSATPDIFRCTELRVMDSMFKGCIALKDVDVIPVNVTSANEAFADCIGLIDPPDFSKATNLESVSGIFSGCESLISATYFPDSVLDMEDAFLGCSNIREAAPFPGKVENITAAYADCIALEKAASIPESVESCSRCYANCKSLYGKLEINTDTDDFINILSGSVENGKELRLHGNCGYLIEIQQAEGNRLIVLDDPQEAAKQAQRLQMELEAGKEAR